MVALNKPFLLSNCIIKQIVLAIPCIYLKLVLSRKTKKKKKKKTLLLWGNL